MGGGRVGTGGNLFSPGSTATAPRQSGSRCGRGRQSLPYSLSCRTGLSTLLPVSIYAARGRTRHIFPGKMSVEPLVRLDTVATHLPGPGARASHHGQQVPQQVVQAAVQVVGRSMPRRSKSQTV